MKIENGDKSSALFLTIENPQSDNNVLWKERSLFSFASIYCCLQNQGISRCFFTLAPCRICSPAGLFTAFKECSLSFQPLEQTKWTFVFSTTCANRMNLKRSLFLMILLIRHLLILYYMLALNSQISPRIETKSTWKTVLFSSLKWNYMSHIHLIFITGLSFIVIFFSYKVVSRFSCQWKAS